MKIVIEDDCENRENMINIKNEIEEYLQNLIKGQNLNTLEYFVIANMDKYQHTVTKYANLYNEECEVEDNKGFQGVGITIEGIIEGIIEAIEYINQ